MQLLHSKTLGSRCKNFGSGLGCADGISGHVLTFVVKNADLHRLFEAWGELKPKLGSVIASLVDAALD